MFAKKLKLLKTLWAKHKGARLGVLFVTLAVLAFLLYTNKNIFVVATVNGRPVWRWELEAKMTSRYGDQTLDELTSMLIIKQAAQSRGVVVTSQEINTKISEIEKSLDGKITLKDALASQGMTMEELRSQLELQILMEKMVSVPNTISDKEISDYLDKNKSLLPATDEATLKEQAKKAILEDKKSTALRQLFADLKAKAKISKFL